MPSDKALRDRLLTAMRELELSESAVVPCGDTLGDMADRSSAAAIELKKKTDFT